MRSKERVQGLLRSPKLAWDVLLRGRYDFIYDQMPLSARAMSRAKRWNLIKAGTDLIYRRLTPWHMPLHMQIELTNYCNLRCPVCPTGSKAISRRPAAMDAGLVERLMDEVSPYLLTLSLWAWGEPLLHPHLARILRAVRTQGVATLLSTNGQNLDDDRVVEALVSSPPTHLILAIDGLTDDTHSKYRVGARLDPILAGVRRLAEIKQRRGLTLPVLHMRYLVMKHNQHEVPQLKDFATRHRFDLLTVRTLSIVDTESPDQIHRQFVPDLKEFRAYDYANEARVRRDDFICQQPFWFPTVFADGTLVPCEQDHNAGQAFGVLKEGVSFADLWFSPHAARVRQIIRDTPDALRFCQNCPFRDRPTTDASVEAFWINLAIAGAPR